MTSKPGTRVLRGPDWPKGHEADGGEGYLGTLKALLGNKRVRVYWDNGEETVCRAGAEGKFDLRVYDSAPAGIRHPGTKCSSCGENDINGILWRCQECVGYDLCNACYVDDKHELRHHFLRVDSPDADGVPVPKRKTSVKVRAIGIFPGATVQRGKDWDLGNQDGGPGSEGQVKGYQSMALVSARGVLRVDWPRSGRSSTCRLGDQGHVDIQFVEEEVGPFFYRDHLPVVDATGIPDSQMSDANTNAEVDNIGAILQARNPIASPSLASPDDKSRPTFLNPSKTRSDQDSPQKGGKLKVATGQSNPSSPTGPVTQSSEGTSSAEGVNQKARTDQETEQASGGEISSSRPDIPALFTSEIRCSEVFTPGDKVAIIVCEERLKELQKDWGGCTARMVRCIGRTGDVIKVNDEGIVSVKFGTTSKVNYRFNPAALLKVKEVKVGDTVRIRPDLEQTKMLNNRVGWNHKMDETVGKVGRVTKIDDDGDVTVSFGERTFIYAPACCHLVTEPSDILFPEKSGGSSAESAIADLAGKSAKALELLRVLRDRIKGEEDDSEAGSMRALYGAIELGAHGEVKRMCEKDSSMINGVYQGMTPLIYASLRGQRACMTTLLDLGADVNKCGDTPRKTPMSAVLEGKSEEVAEVLLERGADVTLQYGDGHTLAHLAAYRGKAQCVRSLAKYGADMNARDDNLDTPLHLAIKRMKNEAVEALVSLPEVDLNVGNKKDFSPLQLACLQDNPRAVELILARDKSGVEDLRKVDSSALMIAAANDHVECIRLLVINGGADVNRTDRGTKLTALHIACHRGKVQAVEALLEFGADVNVQDDDGDTPLHLAIGGKIEGYGKSDKGEVGVACRIQIGTLLISRGAHVDAENNKGRHPFLYGRTRVRDGIVAFMKQNPGVVKMKNPDTSAGATRGIEALTKSRHKLGHGAMLKEALKGMGLPCGVCGKNKSDVTLKPCQHKSACSSCMDKVKKCPLCDEPVTDKVITGADEHTLDPDQCKQS